MRVIKEGTKKLVEVKEICHKCDTKFAYTPADIQVDSRDGDYVVCPICKAFIAAKRS